MRTLLITDDLFLEHDPGPMHVEAPARLEAVRAALARLPAGAAWGTSRDATTEEINRVHAPSYLRFLERHRGRSAQFDADTFLSRNSVDAALRAAGSAAALVDELIAGTAPTGFALIRPPGHHAESARPMGYCLLNNVAIAAAHARARGLARVAIVDWDVHHGNGTQHIFAGRDDVLYLSTHRDGVFYPGTGELTDVGHGRGEGFSVNVPLPPAMGDGDYGAVFHDLFAPVLERFRPSLILVSAGFDPLRTDPVGGMQMTEQGFAALCALLIEIARRIHAPLGLVLEGGYDPVGLRDSVRACVEILAGGTAPLSTAASREGAAALGRAVQVHRGFWNL